MNEKDARPLPAITSTTRSSKSKFDNLTVAETRSSTAFRASESYRGKVASWRYGSRKGLAAKSLKGPGRSRDVTRSIRYVRYRPPWQAIRFLTLEETLASADIFVTPTAHFHHHHSRANGKRKTGDSRQHGHFANEIRPGGWKKIDGIKRINIKPAV